MTNIASFGVCCKEAVQPEASILASMRSLDEEARKLHNAIAKLSLKLKPVLKPISNTPLQPGGMGMASAIPLKSFAVGFLDDLCFSVHAAILELEDIADRAQTGGEF